MGRLIENEVMKTLYKKRLQVIAGILFVLIALFAYGEHYTITRTQDRVAARMGVENAANWQNLLEQQLVDLERRQENSYISEEGKASLRVRAEQLQFYLDNDVNPINSSVARFMGRFMEQSVFLFLPLLIILLAGDMVSGEVNAGTIKLVLTRAVPRWKILFSKLMALVILEMLVILLMGLIAAIISLVVFRYGGFSEPVITGFRLVGDRLDTSFVRTIPQWQYLLIVYAIGYFVAFVIGCLSLMVSVLVRSTSVSIGIMMSSLIGGSFLSFFIEDWVITRYLYTVNLNLTGFISGSFQMFEGLSMLFSTSVLLVWSLGALAVAFAVFTQKDVLA
ncbi:MAG: ABC transporter permease [Bacillota bacterium]|nr:ABC transporter permease [Bacillota bacterium]MDW7678699.1 ABC transporter permease [Bacillota bacterium]